MSQIHRLKLLNHSSSVNLWWFVFDFENAGAETSAAGRGLFFWFGIKLLNKIG